MPYDFELPADLADNVTVEYIEDEEFDNLEEAEDEMEELPEDKAEYTFKQHKESVFTVTVNSSGTLIASGGEDDMGYLWEASSGKVVLECSGHKDSVTQVKFSNDDKYLATGDMCGLIQVWDVAEKKLVWCHECDDIEWLQWHDSAYVLICGLSSGEIYMFKIPQGNLKTLPTNGSRCNCGALLASGTQIAAGYDDGSVRIWDLKTTAMISQINNIDSGSVTNLYLSTDGKLMIACGLKSAAFILKTNDCKIATSFKTDENDEIEAAAFCPEPDLPIVATGTIVKIFRGESHNDFFVSRFVEWKRLFVGRESSGFAA